MGLLSEGYSGSDIAIIVREALMEPLRKCQTAKQFSLDPVSRMYSPCEEYPNCPYCPMLLSDTNPEEAKRPCRSCGAVRMTLYDVPSEQLLVPVVKYSDFQKALRRGHSSVATEEIQRFISWTEEFGQDG